MRKIRTIRTALINNNDDKNKNKSKNGSNSSSRTNNNDIINLNSNNDSIMANNSTDNNNNNDYIASHLINISTSTNITNITITTTNNNMTDSGKTSTVIEAIQQMRRNQPLGRILACAPSDSAADVVCQVSHSSYLLIILS